MAIKNQRIKHSPWVFKNKPFTGENVDESWFGFVYLLTLTHPVSLENFYYIGKKNFFISPKRQLKKSEMPTDKRMKTYKRVKKLNFENYCSSAKTVSDLMDQGYVPTRRILEICLSSGSLTYAEAKWMFKLEVLKRNDFLNDNILGSFYRWHLTGVKTKRESFN